MLAPTAEPGRWADNMKAGVPFAIISGGLACVAVAVLLADGTPSHPKVVAIYSRALGFGEALLAPELADAHQTSPMLGAILIRTAQPLVDAGP